MTGTARLRAAIAGLLRGRRPRGVVVVPLLLALAVTASASSITIIRIHPGDTLSAIAARYHTSVARLVALNHLPGNGNLIYAGQTLRIPTGSHVRRAHWRTVTTHYVVRPGDSLYAISARFHADSRRIARVNHLPSSLVVIIGQRLAIPHRVHVSARAPHRGASVFAGRSEPGRATVAAVIRATARRWGIDERLALAVSWQESGFQMRVVSGSGAIGAMQVMPSTGRFMADYVVHRPLDLLNVRDNATAGVGLLAILLRETHGNATKAVAGYYQGLASVDDRGMFSDTKRYVANVLALRGRF